MTLRQGYATLKIEKKKRMEITSNYFLQAMSVFLYTEYLIEQSENM